MKLIYLFIFVYCASARDGVGFNESSSTAFFHDIDLFFQSLGINITTANDEDEENENNARIKYNSKFSYDSFTAKNDSNVNETLIEEIVLQGEDNDDFYSVEETGQRISSEDNDINLDYFVMKNADGENISISEDLSPFGDNVTLDKATSTEILTNLTLDYEYDNISKYFMSTLNIK